MDNRCAKPIPLNIEVRTRSPKLNYYVHIPSRDVALSTNGTENGDVTSQAIRVTNYFMDFCPHSRTSRAVHGHNIGCPGIISGAALAPLYT